MNERRIAFLRPEQISAEMQQRSIVYLPVGPLEWHGPHLPFGVDALNAENAAIRSAERTGGLVLPTFYWGTERERPPQMLEWLGFNGDEWIIGMDFPANSLPSMYAREEVYGLLVREQLRLAVAMGFRLIVLVSGHAAENHLSVLDRISAEFNADSPAGVLVVLPFVQNENGIMEVGHASKVETSVMLALAPDTVALENLPNADEPLKNTDYAIIDYMTFLGKPTADRTLPGFDDPRFARAELGLSAIQTAVDQIVEKVNEAYANIVK